MTGEQEVETERAFMTLARVQQAIADPELSTSEKINRVLTVGADTLGFPVGYVTHIDGESQRIIAAVGDHDTIYSGAVDSLEETYCKLVVDEDAPVVLPDTSCTESVPDAAADQFCFGCYVGGPISVTDEYYGTVCFADETPRVDDDAHILRTTITTIAQIIEYELERERYENQLEDRKQRLRLFEQAVEQAGHAVLITDRTGKIIYVNRAFESQTGYSRTEAIGLSPRILQSGKHSEEFYSNLWRTVLSGEQWRADIVNRRKSGDLYQVDQEITPIIDEDGTITHFVAIQSDVTTRRLREQQLTVLNRILRHNIRNGTNIIDGYASLLEREEDDDLESYIDAICGQTADLDRLGEKAGTVRSLFNEGISTDEQQAVGAVLTELVDAFAAQYPDATLTIESADRLHVRADERLQVALCELLDNAVSHTDHAAPTVSVTVRPSSTQWAGDWVDIVIADDGPGIPDQERTMIESGEETPLIHGSGLGLWIAHWAVSLLGGELMITDNEPRGTRTVIRLPRATPC